MQQQGGRPERAKIVLYFTTLDKGLVLNATNKNTLVTEIGKDPAVGSGAEIGLYTIYRVRRQAMKGLRLKVLAAAKAAPTPKPAPSRQPSAAPKAAAAEEPIGRRGPRSTPGNSPRPPSNSFPYGLHLKNGAALSYQQGGCRGT